MGINFDSLDTPKKHKPKGRVLIHGANGTGKTTLAASLASLGPQLYLYFPGEEGIGSLSGTKYEDNIKLLPISHPDQLDDEVYPMLLRGQHHFESLVVDSVTALQSLKAKALLNQPLDQPADFAPKRDYEFWNDLGSWFNDFFTFWYALASPERRKSIHVAMIAQTKQQDQDGVEEAMMMPDLNKGPRAHALRVPDHIFYTFMEDDEDQDLDEDEASRHAVRIKASETIKAKIHTNSTVASKLPAVLGRDSMLELPKILKILGNQI